MPIRKAEKKAPLGPPPGARERTGQYTQFFTPPSAYQAIQPKKIIPPSFVPGTIPSISTRDLGYFFNIAASLYQEPSADCPPPTNPYQIATLQTTAPPGYNNDAPPGYGQDFLDTALDSTAILVMRAFRQTRVDVHPIAERFHFGPADRQPLYSLTAQPSIRSAMEYNELVIKRRDPIHGVWYHTCTSDIEPSLDLVRPGNWTVAKLVLESMPVWKKIIAGTVMSEAPIWGKGNSLRLSWGDRQTLGPLGNAYGLWWDSGVEGGLAEAFYIVEGWRGFDSAPQGLVRVKPPVRDANGRYQDPRHTVTDLAVLYFHTDGKSPPQFVCMNIQAQIRMDVIMAGLMTVLVVETRKVATIKVMGTLPAYDSDAHWSSPLMEEGMDVGDAWGS